MAVDAKFLEASQRCQEISERLHYLRKLRLDLLLRMHGVLTTVYKSTSCGYRVEEVRLVLGNHQVVKFSPHHWGGHMEDNLREFDPEIAELEDELEEINKKHHLFP